MRRGVLLRQIASLRDDDSIRTSLYRELRHLITGGYLPAGARLPSSRTLASDLRVSRTSVVAAFERLIDEGLVVSRRGTGCFVNRLATVRTPVRAAAPDPHLRTSRRAVLHRVDDVLRPATEHFPLEAWKGCMQSVARRMSMDSLRLDAAAELRSEISAHLAASRGVRCKPEQVAIFPTRDAALSAVFHATTDRGDRVVSTNEQLDGPARVIHCISQPGAANRRLLDTAARWHSWVVEDDRSGELAGGTSLHALDRSGRVIFIGTFAGVLAPIEIAYVIVPETLAAAFPAGSHGVSPFEQQVLARFMRDGHLTAHIRRMRAMCAARREALDGVLQARGFTLLARGHHLEIVLPASQKIVVNLAERLPPNVDDVLAEISRAMRRVA